MHPACPQAHKPACLHLRATAEPAAGAHASAKLHQTSAAPPAPLSAVADAPSAGYSGTLRWGPETVFPPLPPPPSEWAAAALRAAGSGAPAQVATTLLQGVLRQQLAGGWSSFVPWRVPPDPSSGKVVVEPTQLDGLSFPVTLMWAMAELGLLGRAAALQPGKGGGGAGSDADEPFTVRRAAAFPVLSLHSPARRARCAALLPFLSLSLHLTSAPRVVGRRRRLSPSDPQVLIAGASQRCEQRCDEECV